LIIPLVIVAVAAAVWATFFYSNFSHLWAPDAMKFAQAGRNLLEGGGFDRDEVWPMSLVSGGELNEETQAVLHPLVVAALFKVIGRSDGVVALASGLFFILAAPLVYFIGRSLFGAAIGAIATLLYLGDRSTLYYSVSGLSESLFTFLLLVLFAALICPGERGRLRRYALAGAVLGLCYLARPVALAFIPAALVYAYFDAGRDLRPGSRVLRAAALLLAAVCVVVIVLAAFGVLGGVGSERNSFHLITNTPDYPGHSYVRSVTPVPFWEHFTAHPEAHIKKWLHQLGVMSRGFFQGFADPIVVVLFVAFPLIFGERGAPLRLFLLAAALVVLQASLAALTMPATRYIHPFVPLGMVFASASLIVGIRRLLPESPGLRAAVVAAVAVAALHPFVLTAPIDRDGVISAGFSEIHGAKDFTSLGAFVQEHTGEDDVILSDAPWIVAWYGDRTSIWLPNSPRDVVYLRTDADIEWLFLTEEYPLPRAWRLLFEGIAAGHESPDWGFVIGVEDDRTLGHLFRARRE
jgi:4-amino-4-deoxy-L-arabinose transferase-like glycosyltransferase